MKKNSRILVAIDGSARSYAALAYLGKLLSKQVEIVLFHIMADAPESLRDLSSDPSYEKESYPLALWKTSQEEFIAEFMTLACDILYACGFSKDTVTVKTQALGAGVARDILAESRRGYDVLVVGRTGISKVEDISLGGIAAKLVDAVVHLPIIVVGEKPESNKTLIAIDGSAGSMKAIRCAGAWLDSAECEILLCHVIRPSSAQ